MYTEFTPQPHRYEGPWTPAPGTEPPPPPPPSGPGTFSVVLRVLAVLGLVFGLCATGTGLVFRQQIKDVVVARQTTVVTPDAVLGRPRLTDPDTIAVVDERQAILRRTLPDVRQTAGGAYGPTGKGDYLMVVAAAVPVPDQAEALRLVLTNWGDEPLRDLVPIAAGPLGGLAECGTAGDQVTFGVCLWADSGSVGFVMIGLRTGNQVAGEYVQIRALFEQR